MKPVTLLIEFLYTSDWHITTVRCIRWRQIGRFYLFKQEGSR